MATTAYDPSTASPRLPQHRDKQDAFAPTGTGSRYYECCSVICFSEKHTLVPATPPTPPGNNFHSHPKIRTGDSTVFSCKTRAGSSLGFYSGSRARSISTSFTLGAGANSSHGPPSRSRARSNSCTICGFRTRAGSSRSYLPSLRARTSSRANFNSRAAASSIHRSHSSPRARTAARITPSRRGRTGSSQSSRSSSRAGTATHAHSNSGARAC